MTRKADPDIRPALLERVLDYLLDKPLSTFTFRDMAASVNVSTFTLVYHFGTRAELVREIIRTIALRQRAFEVAPVAEGLTLDGYLASLRGTFDLTLLPRNRALQRLEFEAQILESTEQGPGVTRVAHEQLLERGLAPLIQLGLSGEDARIERGLLLDTFYGIQVGLVINDDVVRAQASFDRTLEQHRQRIESLVAS